MQFSIPVLFYLLLHVHLIFYHITCNLKNIFTRFIGEINFILITNHSYILVSNSYHVHHMGLTHLTHALGVSKTTSWL